MSTATDLFTDNGWDGSAEGDFGLALPGAGVGGGFLLSVEAATGGLFLLPREVCFADILPADPSGLATLTDLSGVSSVAAPFFFVAFLGDDRRVTIMGGLGVGVGGWLG
jgi:hypothetical protein